MTSTSSTGAEPRAGQVGGVGVLRPDPPTSTGSDLPNLKPFFFGGIASCVAETVTFPIDTAKTRLQLQGMFVIELLLKSIQSSVDSSWSEASPNLNFCSMKIAHRATYV